MRIVNFLSRKIKADEIKLGRNSNQKKDTNLARKNVKFSVRIHRESSVFLLAYLRWQCFRSMLALCTLPIGVDSS